MKFVIGEGWRAWLNTISSTGFIGLAYKGTFYGLISYILFGVIIALAIIGLGTVIGWIFKRAAKKKKTKIIL